MKRLSWVLMSIVFGVSTLRPMARAEIAIGGAGAPPPDTGSTVTAAAASDDQGTSVTKYEKPADEENKWMPWILGIGSAVVALVGGFVIADSNSSDASDSAEAAEAATAAAAAATAATAAAATAAASNQTAAVTAAAADAQAALTAATDPLGPFSTRIFVTGTFVSSARTTDCGSFSPSITFSISQSGNFPGGVTDFRSSVDCATTGRGGLYEQVSDNQFLIRVDDQFYLGRASIVGTYQFRLDSGVTFSASSPGAGITVIKK